MPRYRSKPRIIAAFEFNMPSRVPKGVVIRQTEMRGMNDEEFEVYNALHDSWIKLKIGDFVRTDQAPNDVYPIDRETFDKTYEEVP